jgi:hypothetical protein
MPQSGRWRNAELALRLQSLASTRSGGFAAQSLPSLVLGRILELSKSGASPVINRAPRPNVK